VEVDDAEPLGVERARGRLGVAALDGGAQPRRVEGPELVAHGAHDGVDRAEPARLRSHLEIEPQVAG
jgi:hypothetical protein